MGKPAAPPSSCDHCNCQWGISCQLIGIFIVIAAGFFAFMYYFLWWFHWDWSNSWYPPMCAAWAILGAVLCVWGCFYEICCKRTPFAREIEYDGYDAETGNLKAPGHYIMITG